MIGVSGRGTTTVVVVVVAVLLCCVPGTHAMIAKNVEFTVSHSTTIEHIRSFKFDQGGKYTLDLRLKKTPATAIPGVWLQFIYVNHDAYKEILSAATERVCGQMPYEYTPFVFRSYLGNGTVLNTSLSLTIPQLDTYHLMVLNCQQKEFKVVMSYTEVNPGGEYLSLALVPLKNLYVRSGLVFGLVLLIYVVALLRWSRINIRIQLMMIVPVVLHLFSCWAQTSYWRNASSSGKFDSNNRQNMIVLGALEDAVDLVMMLVLAKGLFITCSPDNEEFKRMSTLGALSFVLILLSQNTGGAMLFAMAVMVVFMGQAFLSSIRYNILRLAQQAELLRMNGFDFRQTPIFRKLRLFTWLQYIFVCYVLLWFIAIMFVSGFYETELWMAELVGELLLLLSVLALLNEYFPKPVCVAPFYLLSEASNPSPQLMMVTKDLIINRAKDRVWDGVAVVDRAASACDQPPASTTHSQGTTALVPSVSPATTTTAMSEQNTQQAVQLSPLVTVCCVAGGAASLRGGCVVLQSGDPMLTMRGSSTITPPYSTAAPTTQQPENSAEMAEMAALSRAGARVTRFLHPLPTAVERVVGTLPAHMSSAQLAEVLSRAIDLNLLPPDCYVVDPSSRCLVRAQALMHTVRARLVASASEHNSADEGKDNTNPANPYPAEQQLPAGPVGSDMRRVWVSPPSSRVQSLVWRCVSRVQSDDTDNAPRHSLTDIMFSSNHTEGRAEQVPRGHQSADPHESPLFLEEGSGADRVVAEGKHEGMDGGVGQPTTDMLGRNKKSHKSKKKKKGGVYVALDDDLTEEADVSFGLGTSVHQDRKSDRSRDIEMTSMSVDHTSDSTTTEPVSTGGSSSHRRVTEGAMERAVLGLLHRLREVDSAEGATPVTDFVEGMYRNGVLFRPGLPTPRVSGGMWPCSNNRYGSGYRQYLANLQQALTAPSVLVTEPHGSTDNGGMSLATASQMVTGRCMVFPACAIPVANAQTRAGPEAADDAVVGDEYNRM